MSNDSRDTNALATLGWPIYLVALLMTATPVIDFVANVWPLRPGDLQWRYGTVGLLSGFLLTPMLGVLLACLVAVALRHRMALRGLAVVNVAGALALFAVTLLFALDVLEYRNAVPFEGRAVFDIGALKAAGKHLAAAVAFGWLGAACWAGARSVPVPRRRE